MITPCIQGSCMQIDIPIILHSDAVQICIFNFFQLFCVFEGCCFQNHQKTHLFNDNHFYQVFMVFKNIKKHSLFRSAFFYKSAKQVSYIRF